MITWLNNKFGTSYTEGDLEEIKNFTLLWNIYENLIFNNSFSIRQLNNEINNRNLNFQPFVEIFAYFQSRYSENGVINNRFQYLHFRNGDRETFVRNVLLNQIQDNNSKILAIGIIVYRFRNNLFHGLKEINRLHDQVENFTYANRYLRLLIN